MMKKVSLIAILFSLSSLLLAQAPDLNEVKEQLRQDLSFLASDALEGRESGERGAWQAAGYIAGRFAEIGLEPMGKRGYFQDFHFSSRGIPGKDNFLSLNKKRFSFGEDFYPLARSSNGAVEGELIRVGFGISAPDLKHDDYEKIPAKDLKGKVFLIEVSSPDGIHPHSKFIDHHDLASRVALAEEKGAAAIIFINSDKDVEDPGRSIPRRIKPGKIPVIFASGMAYKTLVDATKVEVAIEVEVIRERKVTTNVIGFIDNGAEKTVVIGAHYDHVGFGMEGSLHRGQTAIHNGADDNASGTSVIMALADYFQKGGKAFKNNNYLFIAFSGEEKGLMGSNHFTKNPTIPLEKINYMINLDMVGRLDPDSKKLAVNGVGTSPAWKPALEKIVIDGISGIKTSESGVGPSDQTSFYLKDIPALHFFSGTHEDYHRPSDDTEKINWDGMVAIAAYIATLVENLDGQGELDFTKTKDDEQGTAPRFTVTLGVVPDYLFEGNGMRIDGVTEGKPASNAGMVAGDVVLQMGEVEVSDMMSYMKALSRFKKGDQTKVTIDRAGEKLEMDVQF